MAYDRPASHQGSRDTFSEIHVGSDRYVYHKGDLSRPKSSHKREIHFDNNYNRNKQVLEHQSQDTARKQRFYKQVTPEAVSHHSDRLSSPPAFSGSSESLDFTSPQPSNGKTSHRVSGNRSARQSTGDIMEFSESALDDSRTTPDVSDSRPSSSFSVYRPLPAIGTPSLLEPDISQHCSSNDSLVTPHFPDKGLHTPKPQAMHQQKGQTTLHSRNKISTAHRVHSAVSDISVISKASSARRKSDVNATTHLVERLDLSQLNKSAESGRRKKTGSSPLHKPKIDAPEVSQYDSADFYDGDDDDSDSYTDPPSDHKETLLMSHKKPVIIPSENGPPSDTDQNILLAVKLPTDGTRHQRYFNRFETLSAVIEFAEEQAGQDFAGYALVCSAPKKMYECLGTTIEEAGLEDRTVFHLEEKD